MKETMKLDKQYRQIKIAMVVMVVIVIATVIFNFNVNSAKSSSPYDTGL
jgi:hypothetical protein